MMMGGAQRSSYAELQRVAGNMASFFCHVDGVAMQFRLE
jgi:hypothetical protein